MNASHERHYVTNANESLEAISLPSNQTLSIRCLGTAPGNHLTSSDIIAIAFGISSAVLAVINVWQGYQSFRHSMASESENQQ